MNRRHAHEPPTTRTQPGRTPTRTRSTVGLHPNPNPQGGTGDTRTNRKPHGHNTHGPTRATNHHTQRTTTRTNHDAHAERRCRTPNPITNPIPTLTRTQPNPTPTQPEPVYPNPYTYEFFRFFETVSGDLRVLRGADALDTSRRAAHAARGHPLHPVAKWRDPTVASYTP